MKNKSTLAFCYLLLFCCISLTTIAQEHDIFEINNNQNSNKQFSNKSKNQNDKTKFYDLAFNLHPTYYIEKNNVKKGKQSESSLLKLTFFDTESFNVLNQDDSNFTSVELVTINLKSLQDLNNVLILSKGFNKLNSLKYIFLRCYFECTEVQLKNLIINDSNVRIFYRIENPS